LRAVDSACVQIDAVVVHPVAATPNDHFVPDPHGCVIVSGMGHVCDTRRSPTVRGRIISATSVQTRRRLAPEFAAPDDHLRAGPHCGMIVARGGSVESVCSRPAIAGRIVSSPGIQISGARINAAPDIHLAAAPDTCVSDSAKRRVRSTGCGPAIRCRSILSPRVQGDRIIGSPPRQPFRC